MASNNLNANNQELSSDNPLYQRITTNLQWQDLVLNPEIFEELGKIRTWLVHKQNIIQDSVLNHQVKSGYRAFFYGPPGTGKTLVASLIGKGTGKEVLRINFSTILSKYIGETEKNIAEIFKSATNKNSILFFDEADALFGKRTEVKDANDRYANIEVSYLLRQIESFPGLIILTSDLKSNMDEAILRNFDQVIYFPMPDINARLTLWKNAISNSYRLAPEVDLNTIASNYELSGGAIINVLRYCALGAVRKNENAFTEQDIKEGIKNEMSKTGRIS